MNKLTSVHTQIPYDYYSLKFCRPRGGIKQATENLGEFLSGDLIENSPRGAALRSAVFQEEDGRADTRSWSRRFGLSPRRGRRRSFSGRDRGPAAGPRRW